MSLSTDTARIQYTVTTTPQNFAVPFYILAAGDIQVIKTVSGVDTTLVLNTDYTVSGAGTNPSTASVNGVTGIVGATLTIVRATAATQPTTYIPNSAFPASTAERNWDRLTMLVQRLVVDGQRCLRFASTNAAATVMALNSRKNKMLGFDNSGAIQFMDPLGAASLTGTVIQVSSLSALRTVSVTDFATGRQATVSGYASSGDGGEGLFYYDSSSVTADNGGTVIAPSVGSGRWLRIYKGSANVRWFGAKGDGVTNDKTAIDAAITATRRIYAPAGVYVYNGKLSGLAADNSTMVGDGPNVTVIMFTDNTVNSLVELTGSGFANLSIRELTIKGPGRASGSNIHGFYCHSNVSAPYNVEFTNVSVTDISGSGFNIQDAFMTRYTGTWVERVGGNGHELSGDQSPTFINSGQWSRDITGWAIWVKAGNPFIQGFNCSDLTTGGARFGDAGSFCHPTIIGMNIEELTENGSTGIQFELGSGPALMTGIQVYITTGKTATYGMRFVNLGKCGIILDAPAFVGSGTYTNKMYADAYLPGGNLVILAPDLSSIMNATLRAVTTNVTPGNGNNTFNLSQAVRAPGYVNTGREVVNRKRVTADYTIAYTSSDSIVEVDATAGAVSISLDPSSFYELGRKLTVKKIDASANAVTITTYGTNTIDGVNDPVLATQWETAVFYSDNVNWLKLATI